MVSDRRDLRRRLFALAAEQAGYFTAAQAKAAGYSYQAQAHHVKAGNWYRVDRGLFRLAEWVPEAYDDLVRWTLWSKGRGVVSHATALSVHGVGEFESPRVDLTVPHGFTATDDAVQLFVAELPAEDVLPRTGYRVTTVLRSLIDVAAIDADSEQLARAIGDAIKAGTATPRLLRARSEQVHLRAALAIERALGLLGAP